MPDSELISLLQQQGWKQRELPGFIGLAGPLWTLREGEGWAYGLLAGEQHLNPAGVVHGGALVTLLDHAISTVAWEAAGRAACVTLQLDTHFAGAVRAGEFAQARAEVVQRSKSMLFMRGTVVVEGELVLAGQAIMKVVARG
ncbi:PaaI family thioesterase [Ramlibacter sp. G-1-2-2]|uniref:PaaI family thioesterase n=1 Tax=Ramlibacter agri TaxID=2728837 RepID=A0A848H0R3_9BURK|nr:PaaI family thioesterase [Ramlibacter agri]NML44395.1 PaaI family thioesterase [Ramlibacter agri]